MSGEVVAWVNGKGLACLQEVRSGSLFATSSASDLDGQDTALVLATDYAELQTAFDRCHAESVERWRELIDAGRALEALQAKLDAVTKERDALREKVLSAIPSNWCDPLLTGDGSALGKAPWGCPEIERLLLGIRERIAALTDQGRAGEVAGG